MGEPYQCTTNNRSITRANMSLNHPHQERQVWKWVCLLSSTLTVPTNRSIYKLYIFVNENNRQRPFSPAATTPACCVLGAGTGVETLGTYTKPHLCNHAASLHCAADVLWCLSAPDTCNPRGSARHTTPSVLLWC